MYKTKQNTLFIYLILFLIIVVFVFPGFIQFFFGVPSTVYGFISLGIIFFIITLDIFLRKKIIYNNTISILICLGILIIFSAIINKTHILKTLLYLIFCLAPLSIIYLNKIISIRKILIRKWISSFFLIVVIIQLPIVIIQKYTYHFLIPLSNASQRIAEVDFMFGTFSLKADHALGFFLIIYLLHLIFKFKSGVLKRFPYFMISYIAFTILIMESNLTKLVLLIIMAYYASLWIFKKINILGISIVIVVLFISYNLAMTSNQIKYQFEIVSSSLINDNYLKAVENGYAKRPHVVLYQLNHKDFKWIGNGPYDYYNILKGEFKNTIHFSQIIWFYNDIGLIGLVLGILASFLIIKNLNLRRESRWLLIIITLLYLFMTNVLGDISMLLSFLLLSVNQINYREINIKHVKV